MDFMDKYLALGISAFLFAIMHGFNPNLSLSGFLGLFLAGILLGISYIYTKNLWFAIFFHLSWNFFQGPVFGFEVSGNDFKGMITQTISGNELLTGGKFGFEASCLSLFLELSTIIVIYFYFKNKDKKLQLC